MKNLRVSSYLNHVDIGDGMSLLYSGSTLCIDLVPTEYANCLSQSDLSILSAEEKEHLCQRGYLTALTQKDELDEFRKMVRDILERRSELSAKQKIGSLFFMLTYNCNLSCRYCFQKSLADKVKIPTMSGEFVDKFFSIYFPQLFPKVPQELFITLFGGEPLLPANREAITRILDYAKKHSYIRIAVSTNATTLAQMADLIGPKNGKISNVHVTLDGDRSLHDENRLPNSGKPTFDIMIAAIRQLIQLEARICIRIHIHPGRLESSRQLIGYLEQERLLGHPQVGVYFSPINTFSSEKITPTDAEIFRQTFQYVAVKTKRPPSNLEFMNEFLQMQSKKILPKVRFCGAGKSNYYMVDPLGDIYGCFEEAGHKDRRIGCLTNEKVKFYALKDKYSRRNLLNLPECIRCSAALFCGGGCPSAARIQKGSMFKSYCHQNKEFIAQTLKAFFLLNYSANPNLDQNFISGATVSDIE